MSSRSYLSIGDVLTLLREEFPDVTISKIRFLESQGLVNPERSPSGYRKFFDHDVERLRWVLRQQREHFLPLKVIRDRLADGELDETVGAGGNGRSEPARTAAARAAASGGNGPVGASTAVAQADEQPTKADEEAMARILADASRRTALLPEVVPVASGAGARGGLQVVDQPPASEIAAASPLGAPVEAPSPIAVGASMTTPSAAQRGPRVASGGGAASTASKSSASRSGASKTPASAEEDATAPATSPTPAPPPTPPNETGKSAAGPTEPAAENAPAPAPGSSGGRSSRPASSVGTLPSGTVTGASMTAEELCAASGLSAEELAGLEGFGLIEPVTVAGIANYDENALTVANLAAQLRTYGIEARHLRLYRNAVDREMGLIEQVIIPLLRQRNPEARQRAVETSDQLAALGQAMRATLLRQALRQHLGG